MARPSTAAVRLLTGEREPCRLATTANIDVDAGGLLVIDGVQTEVGDRVLVKDQSDGSENGIRTVSAGQWYRAADARTARTMQKGTTVHVAEGSTNAGKTFVFNTLDPVVGDSDIEITFYISDDVIGDVNAAITAGLAAIAAAVSAAGFPSPAVADTALLRASDNSVYIARTKSQFKTWLAMGAADVSFLQTGTGAVATTVEAKLRGWTSVKDFGAVGDGVIVTATTSITSGAAALTATGAAFTLADVGKRILVPGAGAAGATLSTTILSFTDATHVTLAANAGTTLSAVSKQITYGADDASSVQAAIASLTKGGVIWFPRSIYLLGTQIDISVSGIRLLAEGRGAVTLASHAAGHVIQVATGLYYTEVRDMQIVRSAFPAISGQDGIHFTGQTERALVENVEVSRCWEGIRCGITGFSKLQNNLVNNCYSNGIRVTNADGAGGLQWTLINNLTQQCNGWGVLYESPQGNASVGEIINHSTYANKLGGMAFKGTDASHRLDAIRIRGGFVGQDGGDEILFDTYGASTIAINGTFAELAGTSVCGVDTGTVATNVGHGINLTANNVAVAVTDCTVIGNSYSGISSNAARAQIVCNNIRLNGAAASPGETSGILINAGNATIVGNSSKGQAFGMFLTNDGAHVAIGNDLTENTTAPFAAGTTLTNSVVQDNIPKAANDLGQRFGTTTNDNARAGNVGEYAAAVAPDASATVTMTIAAPAVVTWPSNPYAGAGQTGINWTAPIVFTTTGALPTGVTAGTVYWIIGSTVSGNTFQIATSVANALAGTAITTTGSQSGTHTGTSALALTTNTAVNVAAMTLTVGDWDVDAIGQFKGNTATTVSSQEASISLASATLDYSNGRGMATTGNATPYNQIAAGGAIGVPIPPVRLSLSVPTTVYLVARSIFGTNTSAVFGLLRARRVR